MSLVKLNLKNNIKAIMNALKSEEDQDAAIEKFATDLADAIHSYVSAAEVSTNVTTVLAGTAGAYPIAGSGSGSGVGGLS